METVQVKIEDLKFADYNPRRITESQFAKLRQSLREFGFVEPVVVNEYPGRENVIVGGHMRTRAATAEGIAEVPCIYVNLDPQKEKLLNIALNRIAGEWDQDKLQEMVSLLAQEGADVKLTGFEEDEIVKLVEEQVSLNMPDLDAEGVQTKSVTIYYAAEVMDDLLSVVTRWPGRTISDKFLALVNDAKLLQTNGNSEV